MLRRKWKKAGEILGRRIRRAEAVALRKLGGEMTALRLIRNEIRVVRGEIAALLEIRKEREIVVLR